MNFFSFSQIIFQGQINSHFSIGRICTTLKREEVKKTHIYRQLSSFWLLKYIMSFVLHNNPGVKKKRYSPHFIKTGLSVFSKTCPGSHD